MAEEEPPIRLILAALFVAARLAGGRDDTPSVELVKASVADADELLRQAAP
jgi:hypothetical protein